MRGLEENPDFGGPHGRRKRESLRTRQVSRTLIEENRERRRAMAIKSREELKDHRAKIRRALGATGEAAAPERGASASPAFIFASEGAPPAQTTFSHGWEYSGLREDPSSDWRVEPPNVLETIRLHPEGIALPDLGNELGVNWRGLLETVRSLVNDGEIERIQQLFYATQG